MNFAFVSNTEIFKANSKPLVKVVLDSSLGSYALSGVIYMHRTIFRLATLS